MPRWVEHDAKPSPIPIRWLSFGLGTTAADDELRRRLEIVQIMEALAAIGAVSHTSSDDTGDYRGPFMSATAAVDESVEVDADPNAVWHALGGQGEPSWWDGMELDVCAEGSFVERWYDVDGIERFTRGRVVEVVPPRRLVLTWADDDWPSETLVTISVEALFDGRSLVRVRHEGWDGLGQVDELLSAHRYGWRHHLRAWAAAASSP